MQYLPLLFYWRPSGPLIRCLGVSIWLRYSYELEGDIVWVPKKHTLRWRWVSRVIRGYVLGVTPREGSETGLDRWKKKFKKLWCPLNGNLWWSNRDLWRWAKPSELSQVRWEGWVFIPPHQPVIECRWHRCWVMHWAIQLSAPGTTLQGGPTVEGYQLAAGRTHL